MQINEAVLLYFGERTRVKCDRQCNKAWGTSVRPSISFSDDPDDTAYLADDELGEAPINPGTYEGGIGKPLSPDEFPQKWCVRECERCSMSERGEPLVLKKFDTRRYNQPAKHGRLAAAEAVGHE